MLDDFSARILIILLVLAVMIVIIQKQRCLKTEKTYPCINERLGIEKVVVVYDLFWKSHGRDSIASVKILCLVEFQVELLLYSENSLWLLALHLQRFLISKKIGLDEL